MLAGVMQPWWQGQRACQWRAREADQHNNAKKDGGMPIPPLGGVISAKKEAYTGHTKDIYEYRFSKTHIFYRSHKMKGPTK
jgi:hypothetical protein